MKKFETPEIAVEELEIHDVVTTSPCLDDEVACPELVCPRD